MSKFAILLTGLLFATSAFAQVPVKNARPAFTNTIGPAQAGGATFFQGLIARGANRPSTGSGTGTIFLSEAAFGQPFATTETLSPSSLFAANVLSNPQRTGVYDILYPPGYRTAAGVTASRAVISERATGGAFRYKWLLYGEGGADAQGNPVIINLFSETFGNVNDENNPWFNDADRALAQSQILVLRNALASAPLNKELQLALLDVYHDLAVAEMQFVNKRLAKLASIRLGLDSVVNTFVIDREIKIRRELVRVAGQAASWYSELLRTRSAGVDPGEFSSRFTGAPFGRFIFVSRVPGRTQTASELAYAAATPRLFTAVNRVATITLPGDNNDFVITGSPAVPQSFRVVISEGLNAPAFSGDTLSIPVVTSFTKISEIKTALEAAFKPTVAPDPPAPARFTLAFSAGNDGSGTASTQSGTVEQIIALDPNKDTVFAGYKDFRTFLTILGQLMQFKADLANLLALRSASGDLTEARQLLSQVEGPDTDTYLQLKVLFPDTDFNSTGLDSTGVRSAFTLVETALSDAVGVGAFVNGTSNALGLDPNFLLLVQKQGTETAFDSYDILKQRINATVGAGNNQIPVGALAVALEALGDPTRPTTGGGAVTAWDTFLTGLSQTVGDLLNLQLDFADRFEEITGYAYANGVNGWDGINPNPDKIGSELATARRTIAGLEEQNGRIREIQSILSADITAARNAVTLADNLKTSITDAQSNYLSSTSDTLRDMTIAQSAAIVTQNAFDTTAAITQVTNVFVGLGLAGVGVTNATAQTLANYYTIQHERDVELAGIDYQTKLSLAEQALTAQQTALEIGGLRREEITNDLQVKSNVVAIAQATADQNALLREVKRIESNFKARRADLASAYFADPIHYQRAESALLNADAAFRRAQKWLFITCRALEYKWQERFAYANPQINIADDIGSIFKARNALELRRIFQSMEFFNEDRLTSPGTLRQDTATVSLRDRVITPNPADINKAFGSFPVDTGLRPFDGTGPPVLKVDRFRQLLQTPEYATGPSPGGGFNPTLKIKIDSTQLEIGQLFAGPKYTFFPASPTRVSSVTSGLYRDKIDWLAVHFVFRTGAIVKGSVVPSIPSNNGIDGSMTYGGNTFFRTRIPPLPDRTAAILNNTSDATISSAESPGVLIGRRDFKGEFIISPFRYFQNTDPSTSIFETFDTKQAPSLEFVFSNQSAEVPAVENRITSLSGFQINDFRELSVATTSLVLNIDANQFKIDDLNDIEIVVQHRAYTRPQIRPQTP